MTEKRTIYVFPKGGGDGMMATAVARNYFAVYGRSMHIGHKNVELFDENPCVVCHPEYAIDKITPDLLKQACNDGDELICIYYHNFVKIGYRRWHFYMIEGTCAGQMSGRVGLSGKLNITPQIFLSKEEKSFGQYFPVDKQIAIISGGIEAYKHWPAEKLRAVMSVFPDMHFVQLGMPSDEYLPGAMDLRGKLTLRQIAGVLNNSRLFVGETGGLMHIARAVNCPAVILSPSFERNCSYYASFNYVQPRTPCNECREQNKTFYQCPHPEICTGNIEVDDVIVAMKAELSSSRKVMSDEFENVTAEPAKGMELYDKMRSVYFVPWTTKVRWGIRRMTPEWLVKILYKMIGRTYTKIK